jgi:hypothetical protein
MDLTMNQEIIKPLGEAEDAGWWVQTLPESLRARILEEMQAKKFQWTSWLGWIPSRRFRDKAEMELRYLVRGTSLFI